MVAIVFLAHWVGAMEPVRYTVLDFEGAEGVGPADAQAMADRVAATLAKLAPVKVIDRLQAGPVLNRAGFQAAGQPSPEAAAREAGQILAVDYVIGGRVSREAGKVVLLTSLVEVRSGEVVRRVRSVFSGGYDVFLDQAPPDNLRKLLQLPAVAEAAPARPAATGTGKMGSGTTGSGKTGSGLNIDIDWRELGDRTLAFLAGRVEAGMRLTHFQLTKSHDSDRFVGYIDRLTEEQNYSLVEDRLWLPANWFVIYKVNREWGVDLSWNKLKAKTHNGGEGPSDGSFELEGPIISGFWRYLNPTPWTPYAGLGLAFYEGGFDHAGWWANGYATPEDYEALGPEPRNGKTRWMSLDDCWGYALYVGTDVKLWKSLFADLQVRYVQVEGDVSYGSSIGRTELYDKGPYNVPFSHVAWSLGAKWEF